MNAQISTWRLALGVFAGVVAANLFTEAIDALLAQQAVNRATHALHEAQESAAKQAQADATARNAKAAAEFAERQRSETMKQEQQESADATRAALEAAKTRREQAWNSYYKRPKECENPPTDQAFVDCSNRATRAREEFNKTYQQ